LRDAGDAIPNPDELLLTTVTVNGAA